MFIFKISDALGHEFYQIADNFLECLEKIKNTIKNPQKVEVIASFNAENSVYDTFGI